VTPTRSAHRVRLRQDHHRERPAGRTTLRGAVSPSISLQNPGGYCGIGGTGVSCPVGLTSARPEGFQLGLLIAWCDERARRWGTLVLDSVYERDARGVPIIGGPVPEGDGGRPSALGVSMTNSMRHKTVVTCCASEVGSGVGFRGSCRGDPAGERASLLVIVHRPGHIEAVG